MTAINIIFVDIDGPLLPSKLHLVQQNRNPSVDNPPVFDNFAVRSFNLWLKYGNAKIVFSTNWALGYTSDQLKDIMSINGLEFEYHDIVVTPKRMSSHRHDEILDWLVDNAEQDMKFIAVDDDCSCEWISKILDGDSDTADAIREKNCTGKWIEVDFTDGLTYKNFVDGCKALGIKNGEMLEDEFGIKQLTEAERIQREKDLELLIGCMV